MYNISTMNITRSRIKNIGKKLRELGPEERLTEKELQDLTEWRNSHGPTLSYFLKLLEEELQVFNLGEADFSITQRLKRFYSIILKLKRFPNMQLSMMDDIAGARVVLPQAKSVRELLNRLKERRSNYHIIKVNNYIDHPKDDGYRSVHIVYKIEKTLDIQLELQLRTSLQHIWATGVEVFGTLTKTSFKTGSGETEWKEFFKFLSSRFAIQEGGTILKEHEIYSHSKINSILVQKIKALNIIEQLNTYTALYTSNWREERPKGRSGKYALLILDTVHNITKVEFYSEKSKKEALEKYSQIENEYHSSDEINIVLVSLDNINKLEMAYPNYFMDTKKLTLYLSQIVLGTF